MLHEQRRTALPRLHAFNEILANPLMADLGVMQVSDGRRFYTLGLGRFQLDPSAWLIDLMERVGLVWDVVRIGPDRMATKALA